MLNRDDNQSRQGRALRPLRVHVFGVSGYNLGDDAIAFVCAKELGERISNRLQAAVDIKIGSADPGHIEAVYGYRSFAVARRSTRELREFLTGILASDVVLLGGGTLIQDGEHFGLVRGVLPLSHQVVSVAKWFARPVVSLPIGIDTLHTPLGRKYARGIIRKVDALFVRDTMSARLARQYAGNPDLSVTVGADPALLLNPEVKGSSAVPPYMVIALAPDEHIQDRAAAWAEATVLAVRSRWPETTIRLLVMDRRPSEDEVPAKRLEKVLAASRIRLEVWRPRDARVATAIIRGARLVVSARLHPLIFGLGYAPLFALCRSSKMRSFLEYASVDGIDLVERTMEQTFARRIQNLVEDEVRVTQQRRIRASLEDTARRTLDEVARRVTELARRA